MATDQAYEHLRIEKEPLVNDRRTKGGGFGGGITRDDPFAHGQRLGSALTAAAEKARQQPGAEDGCFILKLNYDGNLDLNKLRKHGIEFLSQEEKTVCVVFADELGLAQFADHLARLGVPEGEEVSYRQILLALSGVDNWGRADRESWAIQKFGLPVTELFRLDIELWPFWLEHSPERLQIIHRFEAWLAAQRIRKIDRVSRNSLLLYRLEVNPAQADLLLEHRDVRLVDLLPRTGISYQQMNVLLEHLPTNIPAPSADAPRICILDSGINSNHPLLRSATAEVESFIDGEEPDDDVGHGTAVAGIALYGDLEQCLTANFWKPEVWLYSGKIMSKAPGLDEAVFDPHTIEQGIERAVEYFAGDHGCRIFNLSIGNENAPYDGRHIRGIAYTLDRLARDYNILFVVSTGNFRGTETVPKTDWRTDYPEYLLAEESSLIDPAPALNVLTVGALANHTATANEQRYGQQEITSLSPAGEDQPAPFTRHGSLQKGTIKPDLVAHGGNLAMSVQSYYSQPRPSHQRLGVLTLNHNFMGATLLKDISGTSFSAPFITHLAGRLLGFYPNASANLLRALLVNHADLPAACRVVFPEGLDKHLRQVAGYGKVNADTLFRSTEAQVVLLAEDAIANDTHQFYELPLPDQFLRRNHAIRQLRITLAYCPPVRTTRLEYVATKISYRLVQGASLEEVQRHFNHALKKDVETISDSRPPAREISAQDREKGTVQSSIWTFKQLKPAEKWFIVITRQDKDWGSSLCHELENYALVATVSDRDNQEALLYTQIQTRLREQARERIRLGS
ncbi:MAG: S8 family peptidase [Syntrophus sp. (in: bacteria)]|nr:S8 family peptidase [Syntrophus sp. (in: bacteria)]